MNIKEKQELKRNLKYVVATGVITVIVTNLVGLILPMYMVYDSYAEYKIYTTYIAFSGLFHFGLINGVYLKYGKFSYDSLPKEMFRTITGVLVLMQLIVAVTLVMIVKCTGMAYGTSYLFVAINMPLININCYFSLINQFTKRFKEDSIVQCVQSVLWVVFIVGILLATPSDCWVILLQVSGINFVTLICHIIINHGIVFGHRNLVSESVQEIVGFIKNGKSVMLSELIGLILINIDLVFVQYLFDTYDFAIYAFAVSIINAIYALMTYVNGICYPYLVREKAAEEISRKLHDLMLDVGVFILATYYILEKILGLIFDKYVDSIPIIKVLYVTILIKMIIMGCYNNVCKIRNTNKIFLHTNIIVVIISVLLNWIAYEVEGTVFGIGVASVASAVIWLMVVEKLIVVNVGIVSTWLRIIVAIVTFFVFDDKFVISFVLYVIVNALIKIIVECIANKHKGEVVS